MNKLFIVLLAVCLVSVHAFVKRDTEPAKTESSLEKLQKDVNELANNINEQLKKAFDPEQIKKGFNDAVDNINKAINDMKAKTEQPKQ